MKPDEPAADHPESRHHSAFNCYYEDTKTASARLSRLRITLGVGYHACFLFLGGRPPKAGWRSRTLLSRCDPIRPASWRQEALPASLETLFVALPCPQTPGGPPRQTIAAFRCCPRYHHNEGSPLLSNFEALSHGFTARCLRLKTPFLESAKTRFRWVVSPCRAGWFPPGFDRVFQSLITSTFSFRLVVSVAERDPVSQGVGWRQGNCFSRLVRMSLKRKMELAKVAKTLAA